MAVEEQLLNNLVLGTQFWGYIGQKLTIPNREVSKLAFLLHKEGSPDGNLHLVILRVSDGGTLLTKLWGLANDLPADATWEEVTFDTPATINEEVRILIYHDGELSSSHWVGLAYQNTNVKADENAFRGEPGNYTNYADFDCAYKYTYEEPSAPAAGGGPANLIAAGII